MLWQRQAFIAAVAIHGDVNQLEPVIEAAGCAPCAATLVAAARAGQVACCQRLIELGCPPRDGLEAAASGGQLAACEWFLDRGASPIKAAALAAAAGGHVAVLDMLCSRSTWSPASWDKLDLLKAVAHGCDMQTLQRMYERYSPEDASELAALRAPAASSPTPDWQAKLSWLEQRGPASEEILTQICEAAARCPDADALARLQWLQQRRYPVTASGAVSAAASAGNLAAFAWLLQQGAPLPAKPVEVKLQGPQGRATTLQKTLLGLQQAGCPVDWVRSALHAARSGDRRGVAWLVQQFPAPQQPPGVLAEQVPGLLADAAAAGSVQLVAWVRGWGAELHSGLWRRAVESGCEALLGWLRDLGCPMPPDDKRGELYRAPAFPACDVATLRALVRLGLPLTPERCRTLYGSTWYDVAWSGGQRQRASVPLLRLLLELGCVAEGRWDEARMLVGRTEDEAARGSLFTWLRQQKAAQQQAQQGAQ
ncbi:hypothetical protein HYH03_013778 [Edaphochlamys debaryana]|uniref:Ankyrin repeat domain-containing protein n=1 Tax=Edaphochlamys debaryana TaxID=47281 RepID=A0A835XVJ9_9CHLO|nr:hypothetical protein HYH03_013778 [Edaphochlamys debaryana]|eukprot:KAG2487640.1 hypothetical protein HYH03_013778 [Edaphochlamys debaryana]